MVFLLIAIVLLGTVSTYLAKKFQIGFKFTLQNSLMYNFINSAVAIIAFLFLCKFEININGITALFALGYAGIVFASLCFNVLVLSVLTIPISLVLSSSGALLLGSLAGVLVFKESTDFFMLLSILIAFCACLLPFLECNNFKFSPKTIIISIGYFVICGANSIVIKLYVNNPHTSSPNQLFLLTNVILCVISFAGILGVKFAKRLSLKSIFKSFSPSQIANISCRTVLSNISSFIQAIVIATIPLATYNIIMPTLTMVATVLVSLLIFKENIKLRQVIAIILMVTASILCNI